MWCKNQSVIVLALYSSQNGGLGRLFWWMQNELRLLSRHAEFLSEAWTLQLAQTMAQAEFSQVKLCSQLPFTQTVQHSFSSVHSIVRDCDLTTEWLLAPFDFMFRIPLPGPFAPPGASSIPCLSKHSQTTAMTAAAASSQLSTISVKTFTACAILNSS